MRKEGEERRYESETRRHGERRVDRRYGGEERK